jgi:tetraacyldisaccharide 4'-kinase
MLSPFSILYGIITSIRNLLYDYGIFKSESFDIPIINVGNLSTGGTGKTPHAEYLISLFLKNEINTAYLSRGYKRKTKGFVLANKKSNAEELGDEAYQIYSKFKISLAVCEDRVTGVKNLLEKNPDLDVIILDDAFQHRRIKPSLNILITPFHDLFYKDLVLPSGNLREPKYGKNRADVVIVSKTPKDISEKETKEIDKILELIPNENLFFTGLDYLEVYNQNQKKSLEELKNYHIHIFTGIGNTVSVEAFLKSNSKSYKINSFSDHHDFTDAEIQKIISDFINQDESDKILLTTEKDYSRLKGSELLNRFKDLPLYVLPISVRFLNQGKNSFDIKVLEHVRKN